MINPEKISKWGQAILVVATLASGSIVVASGVIRKASTAVSRIESVPMLEQRVQHLESQSIFVVKGIEKLTKTKYRGEN